MPRSPGSLLAVGLNLGFLFAGEPLSAAPRGLGADSPEALVLRLTAAREAGDFGELAACLTPATRSELALTMIETVPEIGTLILLRQLNESLATVRATAEAVKAGRQPPPEAASMSARAERNRAAKEERDRSYQALLAKHGLTWFLGRPTSGTSREEARQHLSGTDQLLLLEDLAQMLGAWGQTPLLSGMMEPYAAITDLQVSGDSATADGGRILLEMAKIEGRWYLSTSP
jgi:hypothetical protein